MFTITPTALDVVRRVTTHPTTQPTSGVRIAEHPDPATPMQVTAVDGPRPGDRVVERDGALLYLDDAAAPRLAGRQLDAVTDEHGRFHFVLRAA